MDRKHRLTSPTDFKRVRRNGRSYAHPLVVLVVGPNDLDRSRFGVTTSHSLGRATDRNRAKRRLRHALQPHLQEVGPGTDYVLIARPPILTAPWAQVQAAVKHLLRRAETARQRTENDNQRS